MSQPNYYPPATNNQPFIKINDPPALLGMVPIDQHQQHRIECNGCSTSGSTKAVMQRVIGNDEVARTPPKHLPSVILKFRKSRNSRTPNEW